MRLAQATTGRAGGVVWCVQLRGGDINIQEKRRTMERVCQRRTTIQNGGSKNRRSCHMQTDI